MQIRIQHQDGREESLTLDASQTLRFGTRRSAEVVLQGAGIFPIHFGIVFYRDAFTVAASKQARKIRVNGARVRKAVLHDGDRIELGQIVITVVDEDSIGSVENLSEDLLQLGVARTLCPDGERPSVLARWTIGPLPRPSSDSCSLRGSAPCWSLVSCCRSRP